MAYMNQDKKAVIAAKVKPILKKYGVKATMAVRNHSTLVLNIKAGKLDFIENYIYTNGNSPRAMTAEQVDHLRKNQTLDVNPHWYQEQFTGETLAFLKELIPAMNTGNHDNSDIQSDYFDVGFYVDVNVGQWNKPYQLEA